jgi:hypothetical protein
MTDRSHVGECEAALLDQSNQNKVQGHKDSCGLQACRFQASAGDLTAEEHDYLPREEQHNQRKEDAAGMKPPRQQHPSDQGAIVEKTEGRQGQRQPVGMSQEGNGREQNPTRKYNGL